MDQMRAYIGCAVRDATARTCRVRRAGRGGEPGAAATEVEIGASEAEGIKLQRIVIRH